jgi:flagellar biosynthesis/type III secretory pathway protein FliH
MRTYKVRITRKEFLGLPIETRRRLLTEQASSLSQEEIDELSNQSVKTCLKVTDQILKLIDQHFDEMAKERGWVRPEMEDIRKQY